MTYIKRVTSTLVSNLVDLARPLANNFIALS